MAHHSLKSAYSSLSERINRFPQGAPSSELLVSIIKILFLVKKRQILFRTFPLSHSMQE